jgi:hypothetical protein
LYNEHPTISVLDLDIPEFYSLISQFIYHIYLFFEYVVVTSIPQRANYSIQNIPFRNEQLAHDHNKEENCEKILVYESKVIYDKMIEDITNKTIDELASYIQRLSSASLARTKGSDIQNVLPHRE